MPTIEQLEKLLDKDPGDAFTLYALAQEHAKGARHVEAVAYYDRCLEADPDYCYAYFHKARSQEAMGDEAGAVATLRIGGQVAERVGDAKAGEEIGVYLRGLGG